MIFTAPIFVIFIAGPVIINAEADPSDIPLSIHEIRRGIVPPPQTYRGTPTVAAIRRPNPRFFPKSAAMASGGTKR
jgi:hypothetical protein